MMTVADNKFLADLLAGRTLSDRGDVLGALRARAVERVGALTVVAADKPAADKAFSHVKTVIRANYSNPPSHGGAIVTKILSTPKLRKLWEDELAEMRDRIKAMRQGLVQKLAAAGIKQDFAEHIGYHKGITEFSKN